jgi:hypothetical protein
MSYLICVHCTLQALASGKAVGTEGTFNETIAEHMQRVHPNGVTHEERQALEMQVAHILQKEGLT